MEEGSKTAKMKPGYQCPELVDKNNWMDGHTWPDKFSVAQTMNEIKVTRTDVTKFWGMNLRFQCCKGISFLHIFNYTFKVMNN